MKLKRTVLGPILVAMVAFVSGGWLLQRGVAADRSVFQSARLFQEVVDRLARDYVEPHPADSLYNMALEGMLQELGDPHTSFMSADEYEQLRIQTTGEYGGLGIQISERAGWITVIAPLPGTPAERAGVLAGDRIVEVDGQPTEGWSDDQAVDVLRGRIGEPVQIKVMRVGVSAPIPFDIVREEIHVQSVRSAFLLEPGIGYAKLDVFSETSTDELRAAIDRLRGDGMRSMILDLRTNPGGLLDQGVSVSDLFVEPGDAIVETRGRDARENVTFRARRPEAFQGMPVVVLVDEYSASAAEIVAGALQDHDRALVVGTTTFGKGSVQTLFPLSGGNFLKMTTGKWYTPSGRSIQKDARDEDQTALREEAAISATGQPVPEEDPTANREAFRTDGGRVVYGGGGIVPDLVVRQDTLTDAEKGFFEAASKAGTKYNEAMYEYAVEFARTRDALDPAFPVTPEMLEEFYGRMTAAGVEVTREQFEGAQGLVAQRLGYEIALAKFGQAAASERANRSDTVVRTAVELLREAPDQRALFDLATARQQALR